MKKYDKLRDLLAQEKFPLRYIHKFIGMQTDVFLAEVETLEKRFPKAKRVARRSNGSRYLAFTFEIVADDADEILERHMDCRLRLIDAPRVFQSPHQDPDRRG